MRKRTYVREVLSGYLVSELPIAEGMAEAVR
jgi:hypothetical protein